MLCCAALPYLAASGIGRIGLLDFDRVDLSNLPRQILYGQDDIGQWKVVAAHRRLSSQFPRVQFHQHFCSIQEVHMADLYPYDLILDATDNSDARYAINDLCKRLKKPWIYGSIHRFQGQASLFYPNEPDYRALFPNASNTPLPSCSAGGVLGAMAGCIGSIQALEATKLLAKMESSLRGKLLVLDALTWKIRLLELSVRENWEISADRLKQWMQKEPIHLIDVRQPFSLEGISKGQKIVLYCQSGVRSAKLARHLRGKGYLAYSLTPF